MKVNNANTKNTNIKIILHKKFTSYNRYVIIRKHIFHSSLYLVFWLLTTGVIHLCFLFFYTSQRID